jgi:glycosyltransferase involved in cell wall biosynthesis
MLGKGWFPEQLGGLDRYYRDLFEHLPEARGLVVGPAPGNPQRLTAASRHDAPLPRRLIALWRAAQSAGRDAAVVDAHFALYALVPTLFGRLRSLPAVVHFQGPWADENVSAGDGSRVRRALRRALERRVYRRAARIVVLTSAFRRVVVEKYRVSPWRVHVVPPGVDLDRFTPGDQRLARERFGLGPDAFVAVAVRRLVPRMGLDLLVEAWADALPELPAGARLLIAGVGPARDSLRDQTERLGLSDAVQLLGSVDDDSLVDLYRAADVGVVPTRSFEGFGLVVIEAAACGTPTIVTDVGGLPEAVRELDPSLTVSSKEPGVLARRLVRAAAPSGLPSRDRTRRFAEGFSWELAVERNREVLREALSPGLDSERRRIRVVYLDHVAKLSGGEIALLRLLPHLTDVDPHVILAEDGPFADRLVQAGISTEVLPMRESARSLRKDRVRAHALPLSAVAHTGLYILRLAFHLRRLRPDIVHTNSLKSGLYGSLAARLARVPVVWHVRDRIADDYLPRPAVRLIRGVIRRCATAVVANSQATLATLGVANSGVVHSVLPDVLPPVLSAPASREPRPCTFGMVGRIAAWKGQDLFLHAFARAFPAGHERAVIVGAPLFDEQHVEDDLRQLVRDLGIDERVEFRGFREDVWSELRHLDVLVHASTTPEPFGQVVVEGMAAGLAVVASDEGGPAEILGDGVAGRLFRPRDVDSLAVVLAELRDSPEDRLRLGAAAREAIGPFHGENVATMMQQVYADAVRA